MNQDILFLAIAERITNEKNINIYDIQRLFNIGIDLCHIYLNYLRKYKITDEYQINNKYNVIMSNEELKKQYKINFTTICSYEDLRPYLNTFKNNNEYIFDNVYFAVSLDLYSTNRNKKTKIIAKKIINCYNLSCNSLSAIDINRCINLYCDTIIIENEIFCFEKIVYKKLKCKMVKANIIYAKNINSNSINCPGIKMSNI